MVNERHCRLPPDDSSSIPRSIAWDMDVIGGLSFVVRREGERVFNDALEHT